MINLTETADNANMIINGYAFTRNKDEVRVINLNAPGSAAVIDRKNEVIETTMNDIELDIVMDYYNRNKEYMEE